MNDIEYTQWLRTVRFRDRRSPVPLFLKRHEVWCGIVCTAAVTYGILAIWWCSI